MIEVLAVDIPLGEGLLREYLPLEAYQTRSYDSMCDKDLLMYVTSKMMGGSAGKRIVR